MCESMIVVSKSLIQLSNISSDGHSAQLRSNRPSSVSLEDQGFVSPC
jgi:hypothetical protein